jgi:hypothetical protein
MKNSRQLARTAHDVRHLCVCEGCKELADDRDVVRSLESSPHGFVWHPSCFYERHGEEAVLKFLSKEDQGKFRMCDGPVSLLKKLWS